ncbi:MAG: Guanylate kinase, partial [uncultured Frankineae bacterium]
DRSTGPRPAHRPVGSVRCRQGQRREGPAHPPPRRLAVGERDHPGAPAGRAGRGRVLLRRPGGVRPQGGGRRAAGARRPPGRLVRHAARSRRGAAGRGHPGAAGDRPARRAAGPRADADLAAGVPRAAVVRRAGPPARRAGHRGRPRGARAAGPGPPRDGRGGRVRRRRGQRRPRDGRGPAGSVDVRITDRL